jgi:hypothetical protein
MADDETPQTKNSEDRSGRSILERGRYQLRLMRVLLAVFCILLLLALLLSLILNS